MATRRLLTRLNLHTESDSWETGIPILNQNKIIVATYKVQRLFTKVTEDDKKKLRRADLIDDISAAPAIGGGLTAAYGLTKPKPFGKTTKIGAAAAIAGTAGMAYGDITKRAIYNKYHSKGKTKSLDSAIYGGSIDADDTIKVAQWVRKNKK